MDSQNEHLNNSKYPTSKMASIAKKLAKERKLRSNDGKRKLRVSCQFFSCLQIILDCKELNWELVAYFQLYIDNFQESINFLIDNFWSYL